MSITTAEIHGVDASTGLLQIPVEHLHPAEDNPRSSLGDLTELVASIDAVGIIEPLVVTGNGPHGWTVVAGHRRLVAAIAAGLATVPCVERAFDSTAERIEVMVVENLQRQDLDPLDEARGFQLLVDHGMTQRQIAERVGCNQSHVSRRLSLLEIDSETAEALSTGEVTIREAEQRVRPPKPIAEGGIVEPAHTSERDEPEVVVRLSPTVASERGEQYVVQCSNCGTLVCTSRVPRSDLGTCPACRSEFAGWLRQEPPVGMFHGWEPVPVERPENAADEPEIVEEDADEPDEFDYTEAGGYPEPEPDELDFDPKAQTVFGQPLDPAWLDTKPWGTYDGNDVTRRCTIVRQINSADRLRHVAAYERAHDGHDEVVAACAERLHELTGAWW